MNAELIMLLLPGEYIDICCCIINPGLWFWSGETAVMLRVGFFGDIPPSKQPFLYFSYETISVRFIPKRGRISIFEVELLRERSIR